MTDLGPFPHPLAAQSWLISVEAEVSPEVLQQIKGERDLVWRYFGGEHVKKVEVEAALARMVSIVKSRPR